MAAQGSFRTPLPIPLSFSDGTLYASFRAPIPLPLFGSKSGGTAIPGGFKSPLPFLALSFGSGTITPIAPIPPTAYTNQLLVSGLDIKREITQIRGGGQGPKQNPTPSDQNLAKALTSVQDWANATDNRVRLLGGALRTGLTRDASGNVVIQAASLTISTPLQTFSIEGTSVIQAAPAAAPPDGSLAASEYTVWVDEGGSLLTFRVRLSDGSYRTGTIAIA